MILIAVCDDNPLHLSHTKGLLDDAAFGTPVHVRTFTNADSLLDAIADEGFRPSIAILDIELGEQSGIALAESINRQLPDCQVIFLSAYAEHASEVYRTRHVWFVIKNRADEFLIPAVQRAIENLSAQEPSAVLSIRHSGANLVVPVHDIIYIERVARKLRIVCRGQTYLTSQLPSVLLSSFTQELPRCHQGFWVNLRHVSALDHNEFVMDDGSRIPISRTYRDAVRTRFFDLYRL